MSFRWSVPLVAASLLVVLAREAAPAAPAEMLLSPLDVNQMVDQQLVIAHVCGHAHFFKHNYMFGHTNRKMLDEMANHAGRIRRYMHKYGVETVEGVDDVLILASAVVVDQACHADDKRRR